MPDGGAGSRATSAGPLLPWLESSPDPLVVVDDAGLVVEANAALNELLGHPAGSLAGRPVEDLVPDRVRDRHRTLRQDFTAAPRRRPMGGPAGELLARRRDGSLVPVEVSLAPLCVGDRTVTVAAVRDVGARRALEQRERLLSDLLDVAGDGVVVIDVATRERIYANRAVLRTVGYAAEELADVPLGAPASEQESRRLHAAIDEVVHGPDPRTVLEQLVRRRDGSVFPAEFQLTYRPPGDGTPDGGHVILVARDITARRRAEAARERFDLMEERERIARDLHDTVVQDLFATGMLLDATAGMSTEPVVAERISRAVDDLDGAIASLRSVVSLIDPPSGALPAEQVLRRVVGARAAPLGFAPVLELSGDLDRLPQRVVGELVQVVGEALSNVARHAGASAARVRLAVEEAGGWSLEVQDDGAGFRPGRVPLGRGLLNLGTRAELLSASLQIESEPGRGTRILIRSGPTALV